MPTATVNEICPICKDGRFKRHCTFCGGTGKVASRLFEIYSTIERDAKRQEATRLRLVHTREAKQ